MGKYSFIDRRYIVSGQLQIQKQIATYNYEESLISEEFDCPLLTLIVFKHDHFVSSRDRSVAFPSFVLVSEVEESEM